MRYVKIIWILLVSLLLTNCVNSSHTGALRTTMCLEYIEDNPYLIAMCAVGTGFVADGSWIEKPDGLRADIDVESATKKNIYEINAYYMKWFPDSNGRFQ